MLLSIYTGSMQEFNTAYYHDDPDDFNQKPQKRKFPAIFGALLLLIGGGFFVQTTLAANVSLNTGNPIEFGQGITATTACSGATNLTITPTATFTNSSGGGGFYFSSVTVSNIPTSCYGKDFTLNAYGNTDNAPLALFNTTSTNAVIYNSAGTFEAGIGGTGLSVSSGSGSFTATFANPVALSSSVSKISIQSSDHSSGALGVNWTARTSTADIGWYGVTYGNGIFVSVAASGTGNGVMTSPDGITWTSRVPAADKNWRDVTYGNGVFVAVSADGTGNRVMTSPDGITWTSRTSAADNCWLGVT